MAEQTNTVSISNVTFGYGPKLVVHNVSLEVGQGEVVAFMGPSGCGKSTLLRLIAGLEIPDKGEVHTKRTAAGRNRDLRFLFQDYDAYPWLTVWQNVQIGSGPRPHASDSAVNGMLEQVGLEAERNQYPSELSGGMRKRLGLARCMVREPPLLLLDEPFASLDVDARYGLYELMQALWKGTHCSVIIVTHDIHEAILLADRIVISGGRPFEVIKTIDVPFTRPREENISATAEYLNMRRDITSLLRSSP